MKTAIITGGANGIGKAIAQRLLELGNRVAILDLDESAMKDFAGKALCKKCDVTSQDEVARAVAEIFKEFGQIDILVNNAGILYSEPLVSLAAGGVKKHDAASFDKVIKSNLYSAFYATCESVEKMILKRTKGVVINISSVCAAGNAGQTAYSAAKAGINAFSATWAKELSAFGIRFVSIAPGYLDTDSTKKALSENVLQQTIQKIPAKKLGTAENIVEGVIFAINNNYFTGKVLEIDGGLVI